MKMMKDYMRDTLKGEVETISVMDLRRHPGECLTQASMGKSFCIKRKGKIVAFLVSPENADVPHQILSDGSSPTLNLPTTPLESEKKKEEQEPKEGTSND